jgi:hypothetical protein
MSSKRAVVIKIKVILWTKLENCFYRLGVALHPSPEIIFCMEGRLPSI